MHDHCQYSRRVRVYFKKKVRFCLTSDLFILSRIHSICFCFSSTLNPDPNRILATVCSDIFFNDDKQGHNQLRFLLIFVVDDDD